MQKKSHKCRHCKHILAFPDDIIYDFMKFSSASGEEQPKSDPDHQSVVVHFRQNALCKSCGHVAYTRKVHVRLICDGSTTKCWVIDGKH